eukprot:5877168-Alexandrium_andersonii.AAC.1
MAPGAPVERCLLPRRPRPPDSGPTSRRGRLGTRQPRLCTRSPRPRRSSRPAPPAAHLGGAEGPRAT